MEMLRMSRRLRAFTAQSWTAGQRYFAQSTEPIPAGHRNSDLSSVACNIGLNRRRDITLRHDLCVELNGKPTTLAEVFKGKNSVIVGLPDAGSICKEKHSPDFIRDMAKFRAQGFTQILMTSVASSEKMAEFGRAVGCDGSTVKLMADVTGGFTRMMGLDINEPGTTPPFSQRYVALVDDQGILLRLVIEGGPGKVEAATAASALDLIGNLSCKEQAPSTP